MEWVEAKMTRLNEPISQTAIDFPNYARKEMPLILDTATYWSEKLNTSREKVQLRKKIARQSNYDLVIKTHIGTLVPRWSIVDKTRVRNDCACGQATSQ